jgi:predicted transcriptional regulator
MTQEEASASIAFLADKLANYHSRLISVEREFKKHLTGCKCHNEKSEQTIMSNEPEECEMCGA